MLDHLELQLTPEERILQMKLYKQMQIGLKTISAEWFSIQEISRTLKRNHKLQRLKEKDLEPQMLKFKTLILMSFVIFFLFNNYLALPKPEAGWTWSTINAEMKNTKAFKILRTEWKTQRGFYKKLEARKKKGGAKPTTSA
jgi:hypothetical protein